MRKKDRVREDILDRLISGRYRFGDAIPVKDLSRDTGISRQPIMTALAALAAEGFVTVVPQVGCQVAAPGDDDIADFYLMFAGLEGLMAELAARRHTPDQLRRLRAVNHEIALIAPGEADAAEVYRHLNRGFHELIHDMARSPLLGERQGHVFAMSDFFIAQTVGFAPHIASAAADHAAIIAAIAERAADAARAATEHHIRDVSRHVRDWLASHRTGAAAIPGAPAPTAGG